MTLPRGYGPRRRDALAEHFFARVIAYRSWLMPALLLLPWVFAFQLSALKKDVRSDAFIAAENPALQYRQVIRERFGLEDPMLVAVVSDSEGGLFRSEVLATLRDFTERLNQLENVSADDTLALASVSAIEASGDELVVDPLLAEVPSSAEGLDALRERIASFPLFHGSLVAEDGSATLIVLQLKESRRSEATYRRILELAENYPFPVGVRAHVAGEGAVTGYLGAYVDADARVLNPIAALVILGAIALAFRRWLPPLLAVLMIVASVSVALGTMAMNGIPFYVVTNAMPVILIGIAVADTIHVCSRFYLKRAIEPKADPCRITLETMVSLWRPITITSLTTVAGFLGLFFASEMPPFRYFGLFTALGVGVAWLYSLLCLPCILSITKVGTDGTAGAPAALTPETSAARESVLGRAMGYLGAVATARPAVTLALYVCLAVAGAFSAGQVRVDDDRLGIFDPSEKIAIANAAIKTHLGGTGTLDVVVETAEPEGLLAPEVLKAIDELQAYGESLDGVSGSRSIVDYLKQMNQVLTDERTYTVPESRDIAAQYLLLYSFSGDPADLAQLIDYDYQSANVRFSVLPSDFQSCKPIVEQLRAFADEAFQGGAQATLSGRVSLDYDWLQAIGSSHAKSVLVAVAMVLVVSVISLQSVRQGVLALLTVLASVLGVYAVMALADITLGVGTSMFAAVAIGLGVDFAIHTITRLAPGRKRRPGVTEADRRNAARDRRRDFFRGTGRALALNFIAVAGGFAVLMLSEVAPIADFGLIVMAAMGVSFIASVMIIPACYALAEEGQPKAGRALR